MLFQTLSSLLQNNLPNSNAIPYIEELQRKLGEFDEPNRLPVANQGYLIKNSTTPNKI